MLYWLFRVEWSATDKEMVAVLETTQERALARVKAATGARYIDCEGKVRVYENV